MNISIYDGLVPMTNFTLLNFSRGNMPPPYKALPPQLDSFLCMLIVLAVHVLCFNMYVVSLFLRKRSLRTRWNLLLLSLTMSDIFTGCITIPMVIAGGAYSNDMSMRSRVIFVVGDLANGFTAGTTILNLVAIVGDRFLFLCLPMAYMNISSKSKIIAVIVTLWITATGFALSPLAWLHKVFDEQITMETMKSIHEHDRRYSIVSCVMFFFPVVLLATAFVSMFRAIRRLGKREEKSAISRPEIAAAREKRALLLFTAMFVLFLICWTPLITIRLIIDVTRTMQGIHPSLLKGFVFIRFLTSLLNPVLFTLWKSDFNKVFKSDRKRLRHGLTMIAVTLKCIKYKRERTLSGRNIDSTSSNPTSDTLRSHVFSILRRNSKRDRSASSSSVISERYTPKSSSLSVRKTIPVKQEVSPLIRVIPKMVDVDSLLKAPDDDDVFETPMTTPLVRPHVTRAPPRSPSIYDNVKPQQTEAI